MTKKTARTPKETKNQRSALGKLGERTVEKFLMKRGYDIVFKNMALYKARMIGEIDILAHKAGILYLIEVRSFKAAWSREDSISHKKIEKLKRVYFELYAFKQGLGLEKSLPAEVAAAIMSAKIVKLVLAEVRFMGLDSDQPTCSIDFFSILPAF